MILYRTSLKCSSSSWKDIPSKNQNINKETINPNKKTSNHISLKEIKLFSILEN